MFVLQDVALVELEDSDCSEEEDEPSSSSSEEDSTEEDVVTAEKLKLPGERKQKANIQVLEKEREWEMLTSGTLEDIIQGRFGAYNEMC